MKQITKEQAIRIAESGLWQDWSDEEKVKFQLYQNRLAMPWDEFSGAMCRVLGRPVFTHEFSQSNRAALMHEFEGKRKAPTFEEILDLIPAEKAIVVPQK